MDVSVSKQTNSSQELKKADQKQNNMDSKGYSFFYDQLEILNDYNLY